MFVPANRSVCFSVSRVTRMLQLIEKQAVFSYVIKEFAHSFSCAFIELWMHLGSLESPQEARVGLGATLTQLWCSPNFPRTSITRYAHAKHEEVLKIHASLRW